MLNWYVFIAHKCPRNSHLARLKSFAQMPQNDDECFCCCWENAGMLFWTPQHPKLIVITLACILSRHFKPVSIFNGWGCRSDGRLCWVVVIRQQSALLRGLTKTGLLLRVQASLSLKSLVTIEALNWAAQCCFCKSASGHGLVVEGWLLGYYRSAPQGI